MRHALDALGEGVGRERVDLFDANDLHVRVASGVAGLHQVVEDLAGAEHQAAGILVGRPVGVRQDALEVRFAQEVLRLADRQLVAQQRLGRSEEHTSELQSLMRISYAVFCLKKTKTKNQIIPLTT